MYPKHVLEELLVKYREHFRREPEVIAYAPGRIEVLGNHTDYNEGFVFSAAIDCGTFFACAKRPSLRTRLVAGDLMREVEFCTHAPEPVQEDTWSNYVRGTVAGLREVQEFDVGVDAMFLGNIPLGSGLSSSAALEMCTAMALTKLFGISIDVVKMAKIGQMAEHHYAGCKCGLLDQISSLCGKEGQLVKTDFRSLKVENTPMGNDVCFVMCNTHAKHALVDGEYNTRRAACEEATQYFASVLEHPVAALRDVSMTEWEAHRAGLCDVVAKRAAHPISENERVLKGAELLKSGDLAGFGQLMFDSHESSRTMFENSCEELDAVVDAAKKIPGVLGARLSGGGFGGAARASARYGDDFYCTQERLCGKVRTSLRCAGHQAVCRCLPSARIS